MFAQFDFAYDLKIIADDLEFLTEFQAFVHFSS